MTTKKSEKKAEKTEGKREPFDASKDECLKLLGEVVEGESIVRVGVYSYDGGPPKIGMTRYFKMKSGEERLQKLGRLELATAKAVANMITIHAKLNP